MNDKCLIIISFLLVLITIGIGLFSLISGINQRDLFNELKNSKNRYLATIVEVHKSGGTKRLYINFQVNGKDTVYKGRANFTAYRNYISVGKEIVVIFDEKNEKYIIDTFMETYPRCYRSMISFGIIILAFWLISITYFIIRHYIRKGY